MDIGKRAVRRRKYLSLGIGELTAAAVFFSVALLFVTPRLPQAQDRVALWAALVPLLAVLAAAGLYWLLARTWVERVVMPRHLAIAYRVLRIGLLVLLGGGLGGMVILWPNSVGVAVLVVAIWVFGAIEYANYFIVRLAYPVSRWFTTVGQWRTPQLVADIRDSLSATNAINRSQNTVK